MTYGIIADVHGNLPALIAVLRALRAASVDRVFCLGDLVGFNADPDRCVSLLRRLGIPSIAGNHDLIAAERLGFDGAAIRPAYALRRTRARISPTTRAYLASLPPSLTVDDGVVLTHGTLDDPTAYLLGDDQLLASDHSFELLYPGADVCFFGHTHEPTLAEIAEGRVRRYPPEGRHRLDPGAHYFINPGSVDASRKTEKLAQMAVYSPARREIEFLSVRYDDVLAEQRATRLGYRIGPFRLHVHELHRWLTRRLHGIVRRIQRRRLEATSYADCHCRQ